MRLGTTVLAELQCLLTWKYLARACVRQFPERSLPRCLGRLKSVNGKNRRLPVLARPQIAEDHFCRIGYTFGQWLTEGIASDLPQDRQRLVRFAALKANRLRP